MTTSTMLSVHLVSLDGSSTTVLVQKVKDGGGVRQTVPTPMSPETAQELSERLSKLLAEYGLVP